MATVTTARILAGKALQQLCGQECVDWAIAMIEQGREGHHLAMLAGQLPPHDPLELGRLRDGSLCELGIPELDPERAVAAHAVECARALLEDERVIGENLEVLKDLFMLDFDAPGPGLSAELWDDLRDFYLLYWAYSDLQEQEYQFYWPDATREDIVTVVRLRAEEFVRGRSAH